MVPCDEISPLEQNWGSGEELPETMLEILLSNRQDITISNIANYVVEKLLSK
jgi:hypothetical protein